MRVPPPTRLLVVRLGSLGDLIHALPAVAALRDTWPKAEIDWVVERPHAGLLALVPALSQVIVLGDRTVSGWWSVVRRLRARRYDVAIDFQGLVKSALLARLSGATRVVGFDRVALREPAARFFYSEAVKVGEGRHVIEKNLALARNEIEVRENYLGGRFGAVGIETTSEVVFPITIPPSPALAVLRAQGVQDFAVINPGAAWPNKRWTPQWFAEVARIIKSEYGWTPVVLWGPGEKEIAEAIIDGSGGVAVIAPATTLADLFAIARDAKVFLSGDTGPLHIAGATGTSIVALFGPTSPARNGPWDDRDVSISRYDSCDCHYKRHCHRPPTWCLGTITVDEVKRAIAQRVGVSR